jgi:histidinol phosphatase-like PHP family hydrolase
MALTCDWHIHTSHSCDCAQSETGVRPEALPAAARERGVADLGISDHVFTPYNLDEIFRSRQAFDELPFDARCHFGVEASCISRWELEAIESGRLPATPYGLREGGPPGGPLALGLAEEDLRAYGIEYVVAGAHWPLYVEAEREAVIRDYHRQNLFLAAHPLVDIVAHPWWWMGHWQGPDGAYTAQPWFDDFGVIPRSMHDEFAAAAVESGTAVEINIGANLLNPRYPASFAPKYVEYLAGLQSAGVRLSVGSDCHAAVYDIDFKRVSQMLDAAGIRDDFWRLAPREDSAP